MNSFSSKTDGVCGWASTLEEELWCLINQERRAAGLYPYRVNSILTETSEQHSTVMRDQGCFSHRCDGEPAVAERPCNAGYQPYGWGECFVGETIAAGYANPANVVSAWMDSPVHRDILMHGELREIGVGYVAGGSHDHYWTVDFGSQPNVLPVFINYDEPETDSRQVMLTLTNEEVSGWGGINYSYEVMISNAPNFSGAQWEPYSLHKDWTLSPGAGDKTVYVKYRDTLSDQVVSDDQIVLKDEPPYDLELSTHSLSFQYQIGSGFQGPTSASVHVANNASDESMTWSATSEPWIAIVPSSGVTPDDLVISVESFTTDTPGTIMTTIYVTSPQDLDAPEEITVSVIASDTFYQAFLPFSLKMEHKDF